MVELLFVLMFFGFLMFTGVTMVTLFLAIVVSLLFVFVVGAVIKLLPWIVIALIGLYIYKHYNKPSSY